LKEALNRETRIKEHQLREQLSREKAAEEQRLRINRNLRI
jgi:hypothetical protein